MAKDDWEEKIDVFGDKRWILKGTHWYIRKQRGYPWFIMSYEGRGIQNAQTLAQAKKEIEYNYKKGFVPYTS